MKIETIADETWRELGQNPTISIASISFWLRANIGKLDTLILTTYSVNPQTLEIQDLVNFNPFCDAEKDMFKELYKLKFYELQLQNALYGGQFDLITSIGDGDGKITKQTKNDLAKTILQQIKDARQALLTMSNLYRYSKSTPVNVVGNDFYSPVPNLVNLTPEIGFYD